MQPGVILSSYMISSRSTELRFCLCHQLQSSCCTHYFTNENGTPNTPFCLALVYSQSQPLSIPPNTNFAYIYKCFQHTLRRVYIITMSVCRWVGQQTTLVHTRTDTHGSQTMYPHWVKSRTTMIFLILSDIQAITRWISLINVGNSFNILVCY